MTQNYSYSSSVKSRVSDEMVNTYFIRPIAGLLVRTLYRTPLTPTHLTLASTLAGVIAARLYLDGLALHTVLAGLCITLKDILDSADGQLARAKNLTSRGGRFLDSIGDFVVNLLVFPAIAVSLFESTHAPLTLVLGGLGFIGTTLRVSYHVFYQASYLHLQDAYPLNRITEDILEEDRLEGTMTLRLQQIFQFLYGWQDRWMVRLDTWCRDGVTLNGGNSSLWYADQRGLRLSGLLGLGTELFVLTLFSIMNMLEVYLLVNVVVMNGIGIVSVLYRKLILARRLTDRDSRSSWKDSR
jgi:phosphatidylglycerophosphate synthase